MRSEADGGVSFTVSHPTARSPSLRAGESPLPAFAGEGNIHALRASAPSIMSMVF